MEEGLALLRTRLYLCRGQEEDVFSMMETKMNRLCINVLILSQGGMPALQSRAELWGMHLGLMPETLHEEENALCSSAGPGPSPESSPALPKCYKEHSGTPL